MRIIQVSSISLNIGRYSFKMNRISGSIVRDMSSFRRITSFGKHFLSVNLTSGQASSSMATAGPVIGGSNGTTTVGIIIIGDEILKGQTQDSNSHFLTRRLFSLGVRVKKISVIPDDLDIIAQEVMNFSKSYTHVITSGGIGPTHDDLTFEGVARAFGEQVHPHPELVALCKQFFGTDDVSSPKLKLAFIPQSGVLRYGIDKTTGVQSKYPLVIVKNVYIFPGVPSLLESAFTRLEDIFRNPTAHFHTRDLYIKQDELTITGVLNATNQRFKDRVITGSYPDFYNNYYNVKLTFESAHVEDLDAITTFLRENLASDALVDYDPDPIGRAAEKVYGLAADKADPVFSLKVDRALKIIEESFERYGADGVCIGFNGGKDCTALLYMVHAVVQRKFPHGSPALQALYIRRGQSFPEAELFVKKCTSHYQLNLININGRIKDALAELKQTHSCLSAVLMGTRRTDPHSEHLRDFAPTDPGWPEYMRVNPMLDWSYIDLWTFIRRLSLPYCTLYDRGYTSLGSMEKTHPNPALQHIDSKGIVTYRPAYELTDSESERAGRN